MTQGKDRFFTVQEAIATLPFVSQVVRRISELKTKIALFEKKLAHYCVHEAAHSTDDDPTFSWLRADRQEARKEYNACLEELNLVGCFLNDSKESNSELVLFPSIQNGKRILLIWRPECGNRIFQWIFHCPGEQTPQDIYW